MSYTTILEEIKTLSIEERLILLETVSRMVREDLAKPIASQLELNASEIRRLPIEERNRILAASAQLAIADYQPGSELVEFTETLSIS